MRTSPYGEDDRAILTNEHIKIDLKKTGNRHLLSCVSLTPALAFLTFATYMMAETTRGDYPVLFWIFAACALVFAGCTVGFFVSSLWQAVTYLRAAAGNRFFVTADTLESKQEGYTAPPALQILVFLLRFFHLFLGYSRSNRYRFSTATYEVAVNDYHFPHNRDLDMNERTLFRHSNSGDAFWLVSLKPGKPVEIYPEKRFRYTDSSPL